MRYRVARIIALTAVAAANLPAQQDTTVRRPADRRITISKGEVVSVPTRVDTVFVTRTDTVTNTITRVDTVTITTEAIVEPIGRARGGPMYWGLFTGTTDPWGNVDRVYTKGFHAGGVLGWERQHSLLGLRLDGAIAQLGKEHGGWNPINQGSGTSLMYHLAADLKVKPLNFGGWALYAIGGGNWNTYKRIAVASAADNVCDFRLRNDCYENAHNSQWSSKLGFNVGGGLDFHIGSQDMFLEARYMAIRANSANTWMLPISLGVRYF